MGRNAGNCVSHSSPLFCESSSSPLANLLGHVAGRYFQRCTSAPDHTELLSFGALDLLGFHGTPACGSPWNEQPESEERDK